MKRIFMRGGRRAAAAFGGDAEHKKRGCFLPVPRLINDIINTRPSGPYGRRPGGMVLPRISFRSFIFFFMAAAAIIAAGVAFYWQQVSGILEQDVKTHVAAASEEAAADFNRLIQTDRQVLESISITVEDTYPWADPAKLTEFLRRQTRHNYFKLLGVVTEDGKVFLSEPRRFSPTFIADVTARTLEAGHYLSVLQADPSDGEDVLVQSVSLRRHGRPVGALFALQPPERYRPLLALSAMGNKGYSLVVERSGVPVLGYHKPDFGNMFDLLEGVSFDGKMTLPDLRSAVLNGAHFMVGYRDGGERRFLHFIPLEINDWYMISALPTLYVEHQAQHLTWLSLILFVSVFIIFCALIFYILHMRAYSNRQLFDTAFVDQLTGADNFNRMCEQFEEKLAGLNRRAALIIFDINKFKVINDLHGYERGNQVLQRVARVLRENIAPEECFCRSTADNFVLLLKYTDRKSFRARLSALTTQLRRDCTVEDSCLMIDVAFGVYEVAEDIPFYIMLDRAHLALENAKKMSFDKCQFYDESDRKRIVNEKRIENTMEQALDHGDFAVYLQPKCDFATGEMRGAEALVRWNRLEEGLVKPDDFIPIFEKNGFILRLDMFILEEVARLLAAWNIKGLEQVPVAVNFSRLHLNDSRYIPQMLRLVDKYGVAHNLIEVELTESVIFNNLERAQNVMRGLHRQGFSVAMDDFGSGYSSLNVLKSLQFDSIKLDKEFLSGFEDNPHAHKVIEGAVAMIKSLGVQVVAEGVETREQADFLRHTGCDLAQGYYFSRPLPAAEFERLLKKNTPQTQPPDGTKRVD